MTPRVWCFARADALAVLVLFLVNAALNLPLFFPGELPFRGSIEGGYASMAKFAASYPNPWGWNPLQYCGLPAQFMYPPGMPYSAAALIRLLPNLDPEYVYRLLAATLLCLGPAAVFVFVRFFTGSRGWALAAALGCTLVSPVYGLVRQIDQDRGLVQLPWRVQVFAKYGEGPHNAGLTLLPLALVAAWVAGTGKKFRHIFPAALLFAAIVLTNWVAALALAWCGLTLLIAWQGEPGFRSGRVLAAAGLAYLLACFWLTPSFIRTIAFNWPADAYNYHLRNRQLLLIAILAAGLALLRLVLARISGNRHLCFLLLSLGGFSFIVLAFYWHGIDVVPESRRYALEFELFLLIVLFELFRLAMCSGNRAVKALAAVLSLVLAPAGITQAWNYISKDFNRWKPVPRESTVEYQTARRLAALKPLGRVFASGGTRFRLNSWFPLAQVGGTFESGLRNRTPLHWAYQIRTGLGSAAGEEGSDAVIQLQAMGVEYVVVHGPKSAEYYRDIRNPGKFEGLLEVVDRAGDDTIYRVPYSSLAHLVRPGEVPVHRNPSHLRAFAEAIRDPGRPKLTTAWKSPAELEIRGPVPEGMLMEVGVNHDPGWTAEQDGRAIRVQGDHVGFTLLHPAPSPHSIVRLRYRGTVEQKVFAGISAAAWLGALACLATDRRRAKI